MMLDAEACGDLFGVRALIEARLVEADRKALQLILRLCGQRGDNSGIESAADEESDRNVGDEPAAHGTLQ